MTQLALFPDLLERKDSLRRFGNHQRTGHGVWSIDSISLDRPRRGHEHICLVVIYDDERFLVAKTGRFWNVEIRHYTSVEVAVTTGWGSSRRVRTEKRQQVRFVERSFVTRAEAVDLAEKVSGIFAILRDSDGGQG